MCVLGLVGKKMGVCQGLVDPEMVLQGCHGVQLPLLRRSINILPLGAGSLDKREMQHHYLEAMAILVIRQVLGCNMCVCIKAAEGACGEFAQPG